MSSREFKYDVFLSHSSKDKEVVRELAERLRNDDVRVWLDEWEVELGDSIPAKIDEGLERSRKLLLVLSKNADDSEWVRFESNVIRFQDPNSKDRRVIPLTLDDIKVRSALAHIARLDWRPSVREAGYPKLLKAWLTKATTADEKPDVEKVPLSTVRVQGTSQSGSVITGLGCFVAEDLVLTSQHLLAACQEFEIHAELEKKRIPLQVGHVEWTSEHGGALLRVSLAAGYKACRPQLLVGPWLDAGNWSNGQEGVQGTAHPPLKGAAIFRLDTPETEALGDLKGSPVFVKDHLSGFIPRVPAQNEPLEAVAIFALLEDERFRKLLFPNLEDRAPFDLRVKIQKVLKSDEKAVAALLEHNSGWLDAFSQGGERALAQALTVHNLPDFLVKLDIAHEGLMIENAVRSAKVLNELMRVSAAYLAARDLFWNISEVAEIGILMEIPVATSTMAELMAAGAHGRPASFLPAQKEKSLPRAKGQLNAPGSCGVDQGDKLNLERFAAILSERYFYVEDHPDFLDSGSIKPKKMNEALSLVNKFLERQANRVKDPIRAYVLLSEKETKEYPDFVTGVEEHLPAVQILILKGRNRKGERETCLPLYDLLKRHHDYGDEN